MPTICDH